MSDSRASDYRLPAFLHGADYNYEQWLEHPEVHDEDFRLMREAGINSVSIGIFSWAHLEPSEGSYEFGWLDELMDRLAGEGIRAVLATPSGARPAWLSAAYPQVRQMNAAGQREPHRLRHNHCRTSPVYREKTAAMNERLAERYRDHPALFMWHVSNEYGAGHCHCPLCYEAFRRWLRKRYGDLDRLNRSWWTSFWSHRYGDWEQIEPVDESVHGLMLDWQRFTSDQTIDFFLNECEPLRRLTPDIPITTNFMQPDVGLDYWRFARHVDIVSWDSYPRWHLGDDAETAARTAFYHDLHRSYRRRPFMLMESTPSVTNWQGVSRPKRPGMHLLSSLQAVAHGSNTVQYFQWRQGRGGSEKFHGAVLSSAGGGDSRTFREVAEVGRVLGSLEPDLLGAEVEAEAAIVYDFQNEWALHEAQLPQNEAKRYQERCAAHHRALWRRGVACDVVSADGPFDGYRLVVAPMLYMLRPGVMERLEEFVTSGGVLVTGYLTGLVGESDLAFLGTPPSLRRVVGLTVEETDTFPESWTGTKAGQSVSGAAAGRVRLDGTYLAGVFADVLRLEGAEPLASYDREYYAGSAAVTVNGHGSGEAFYLATRLEDRFLDHFYRGLLDRHGLRRVAGELPGGVSVVERRAENRIYTFLMNFSAHRVRLPEVRLVGAQGERLVAADVTLEPYGLELVAGRG